MDNEFQETINTKPICSTIGTLNESIYIDLPQNTENISGPENPAVSTSESLDIENQSKTVILNSSTEDKNTAVEALRKLGNFSISAKAQQQFPITCLNCNTHLDEGNLENHKLSCKNCRVKCYQCDHIFDYQKYSEHLPCNDNVANKCKICGICFDDILSLNAHSKVYYSQSTDSKSDDDFVLDHLNKSSFPVLNSIWDDYEIIDENITVVTQEMGPLKMTDQSCSSDKSIECSMQSVESPNTSNITVIDNDLNKTNVCKQCNRSFKREKAYLSHLKLHSSFLDISDTSGEESIEDDQFLVKRKEHSKFQKNACSHCQKSFSTKQRLDRHMWVHRKKTFTCEMCASCFKKRKELYAHRLSTHQSTSNHYCTECGKSFTSRQGLWEHRRLHDSKNHLYKCKQCSKKFSSRQGYLIHIRTHNDERPFKCHFCKKAFRDGGTLKKHERIHTGERPHICPLCSKAFNQKVVLREHVRCLHVLNWKPNDSGGFQCSLCDVIIIEKDYLCAHIIKHSDNLPETVKNLVANSKNATSNSDECNEEVGTEIDDCKIDIDDIKIEDFVIETSYNCDLCDEEFLSVKELTEHVQVHL